MIQILSQIITILCRKKCFTSTNNILTILEIKTKVTRDLSTTYAEISFGRLQALLYVQIAVKLGVANFSNFETGRPNLLS
jgi:hypothetical protein